MSKKYKIDDALFTDIDTDRLDEITSQPSPVKDLTSRLARKAAIKRDRFGLSVIENFLGYRPTFGQIRNHARFTWNNNALFIKLYWGDTLLCWWTDWQKTEQITDAFTHILELKFYYKLAYKDDSEIDLISENDYREWVKENRSG